MDPDRRRALALKCAFAAAAVVTLVRAAQWAALDRLAPLAPLDVLIAGAVAYLLVIRLLDPRTWTYTEDTPWSKRLYTFHLASLVYGAVFGLGLAPTYGLTVGMAYGSLGAIALVTAVGCLIFAVNQFAYYLEP